MFKISETILDPVTLKAAMEEPRAGAFVSFEGWVRNRNEGRDVLFLEYECYRVLAMKEGRRILEEALEQFDVIDVRCVHRTGRLEIGELAVWVAVTAEHRGEAFKACQYVIDQVKHRVPIWKKETYTSGEPEWVNCTRCAAHSHAGEEAHR